MTSSVGDMTSLMCEAVALAVLLAASLSQEHPSAAVAVATSASSPSFPWRIPIGKNVTVDSHSAES